MQRPDKILRVLQPIWHHGDIYIYIFVCMYVWVCKKRKRISIFRPPRATLSVPHAEDIAASNIGEGLTVRKVEGGEGGGQPVGSGVSASAARYSGAK